MNFKIANGILIWDDGSCRSATDEEVQLQANLDATKKANAYLRECHGNWSADAIRWKNKCEALQVEVERLKSEQQGEMWYALDYGFEGQYYELESIIEDFESDYGTGDIEEVKVAQLTTVKHPNKFLAKLWVDGAARLFDTREEAEAAIAESKEQAND